MRGLFFLIKLLFIAGVVGAIALAIFAFDYYDGAGPLPAEKTILFARGQGFEAMVDEMASQGVIDQPLMFKGIALAYGSGRKFKAGEYRFTPAMTPHAIMTMIVNGKVVQHKITVPEGWTVRDIIKLLQSEPVLDGDIPPVIAEGSLMPETYKFVYGYKRIDLIGMMQAAMHSYMDSMWEKRKANLPFDTKEKAMVLASIVEKETGLSDERGHVASVFINRLKRGIRLQSDPTVAYGVEQALGGPLGRPLMIEDLQTPTPYNTYMIDGLPPAPICNPGRASIDAVLNPPDTDDLYFVATGHGGHNFAATLEQHNKNVQAYRARIAKQPQ